MKNIRTKIITLGVLATIMTTSTPVFAATKSSESKNAIAVTTTTNTTKSNATKLGTYWSQHVWDVVDAGGVVKYGDKGQAVSEVQGYLRLAGYNITNDSVFGSATRDAVKSYQRAHGLSADGIVGKSTWDILQTEIN